MIAVLRAEPCSGGTLATFFGSEYNAAEITSSLVFRGEQWGQFMGDNYPILNVAQGNTVESPVVNKAMMLNMGITRRKYVEVFNPVVVTNFVNVMNFHPPHQLVSNRLFNNQDMFRYVSVGVASGMVVRPNQYVPFNVKQSPSFPSRMVGSHAALAHAFIGAENLWPFRKGAWRSLEGFAAGRTFMNLFCHPRGRATSHRAKYLVSLVGGRFEGLFTGGAHLTDQLGRFSPRMQVQALFGTENASAIIQSTLGCFERFSAVLTRRRDVVLSRQPSAFLGAIDPVSTGWGGKLPATSFANCFHVSYYSTLPKDYNESKLLLSGRKYEQRMYLPDGRDRSPVMMPTNETLVCTAFLNNNKCLFVTDECI